jgi:hypothetical protein
VLIQGWYRIVPEKAKRSFLFFSLIFHLIIQNNSPYNLIIYEFPPPAFQNYPIVLPGIK